MTITANGKAITQGELSGDVHVRVRVGENPGQASDPGDADPGTTYTRVISHVVRIRQLFDARDFVSLSVTEFGEALASGWGATEQPQPLAKTWREVIPARSEVTGWPSWVGSSMAGLFRALVHTLAYLAVFSTATRKRAAVAAIVVLLLAGVYTAGQLAG